MQINEKVLSLLEKMEENTRGMSEAVKEAEKSVSALEKSLTNAGDASQSAGAQLSEMGSAMGTVGGIGDGLAGIVSILSENVVSSIPIVGNVLSLIGTVGSVLSGVGGVMEYAESKQKKLTSALEESRKEYKEMIQEAASSLRVEQDMVTNTDNLISKYEELRDMTNLSAGEQVNFYNVVGDLVDFLPDATKLLWEQNDAYKSQLAVIQDLNKEKMKGALDEYVEEARLAAWNQKEEAWKKVLPRETLDEQNQADKDAIDDIAQYFRDNSYDTLIQEHMEKFLSQEKFEDMDELTKKTIKTGVANALLSSSSWVEFEQSGFWKTANDLAQQEGYSIDVNEFKEFDKSDGEMGFGFNNDVYNDIYYWMGKRGTHEENIQKREDENQANYDFAMQLEQGYNNGDYMLLALEELAGPRVVMGGEVPDYMVEYAEEQGLTFDRRGNVSRMTESEAQAYLNSMTPEERMWDFMTSASKEDLMGVVLSLDDIQSLTDYLALSEDQQLLPEEQNMARSALFGLQGEGYLEGETLPTLTSEDLDALIGPLVDQNYSAFTEWFDLAAGQVSTLLDEGSKSLAEELQETVVTPLAGAIESGSGSIDDLTSAIRRGIPMGGEVFGEEEEGKGKEAANNALGTSYFGGGMTWVGEHGPELMDLPAGSKIYSNSTSKNMSAGGGNIYITVQNLQVREEADIEKIAAQLVEKLEETIFNMP